MRFFIIILILSVFPLAASAVENNPSSDQIPEMSMPAPGKDASPAVDDARSVDELYICPMHPHIHGKKGDRCPICGMDLVPQTQTEAPLTLPENDKNGAAASKDETDKDGAIYIEPVYRQALGVGTATVNLHDFGKAIHAFGHVAPNTRLERSIAVRTAGWIVDLNADAVGDTVKKGDLLFTYYSPDLMTAQSDYLQGNRVGNAEQRLRLHGMDGKAIAELKKNGRFLEETPFYASADGTVASLNVRKGAYLEEGGLVLTLQDYAQIWVQAHLPLRDMKFLKIGAPATATIENTGESFNTLVDFIYPETDPESRNGLVRLVLDNPDGKLKTDALVNVSFEVDSQRRLAVPAEAVLYGKQGAHVIASLGDGYFRPVQVKTGITSDGMTEILFGLKEGDKIVAAGQFMIDAESSLSGGMANMAGIDHSAHGQQPPAKSSDAEGTGNVHKH